MNIYYSETKVNKRIVIYEQFLLIVSVFLNTFNWNFKRDK